MILPGIGGAIAAKTFPSIRGTAQVSSQLSGATFSPSLPTHQKGDLLLVLCTYEDDRGSLTDASATGWTTVFTGQQNGVGSRIGMALFSKTATNGSTTISIANSNGQAAEAIAYAVMGAFGSVASAVIDGAGSLDPPSLTPSWGADVNLWFAGIGNFSGTFGTLSQPSGFSGLVIDSTRMPIACCDLQQQAATVDPTAFTNAGAGPIVTTFAVRPA